VQYLFGINGVNTATLISIAILGILLLLWNNKNQYIIMEYGAKIGLSIVLAISIGVVVYLVGVEQIPLTIGTRLLPDSSDSFGYVAALAFGGVAGVLNLVQSDWIASKHYGATSLKNPETIDYTSPESQQNFDSWFKAVTREHFLLFFMGNLIGITLIGLVASLILPGFNGSGFDILRGQVDYFVVQSDFPWLGLVWGIGVILLFLMAQITILDAAGKLLKRTDFGFSRRFTDAQLSQLVGVLGIMILGVGLVLESFSQPGFLLKLSAVMSAAIMAVYPVMLIRINSSLPEHIRPNLKSRISTISCSIFYGAVVIWMITTLF